MENGADPNEVSSGSTLFAKVSVFVCRAESVKSFINVYQLFAYGIFFL